MLNHVINSIKKDIKVGDRIYLLERGEGAYTKFEKKFYRVDGVYKHFVLVNGILRRSVTFVDLAMI